jgi:glucan phosphoethanolaminetransferase (alkaline phosphatase superfamily)
MDNLKMHAKITLFLAGLSLIAFLFCHLALTDINHGETDLSLEWTILRIAAVIFLAFIVSTVLTIRQVFKINH